MKSAFLIALEGVVVAEVEGYYLLDCGKVGIIGARLNFSSPRILNERSRGTTARILGGLYDFPGRTSA